MNILDIIELIQLIFDNIEVIILLFNKIRFSKKRKG